MEELEYKNNFPMFPECKNDDTHYINLRFGKYEVATKEYADWRLEMARRGWFIELYDVGRYFEGYAKPMDEKFK